MTFAGIENLNSSETRPSSGIENRSNFGPNGGHECRGGAIGDLMGVEGN